MTFMDMPSTHARTDDMAGSYKKYRDDALTSIIRHSLGITKDGMASRIGPPKGKMYIHGRERRESEGALTFDGLRESLRALGFDVTLRTSSGEIIPIGQQSVSANLISLAEALRSKYIVYPIGDTDLPDAAKEFIAKGAFPATSDLHKRYFPYILPPEGFVVPTSESA